MGSPKHPDGVETRAATEEDLQTYLVAREALSKFQVPVLVGDGQADSRLFLASFDGTGNSRYVDTPENRTNVAVIYEQTVGHAREETRRSGSSFIQAGYVEGVGTQGGLRGVRDLATGHTYESRLEEMYLQFVTQSDVWLEQNPQADIRIAAIGFSRGAEQAAGFTRMVEARGIQNPESAEVVRGRDGLIERVVFTRPPLREPGTVIQVVGLFDPVGTGVPRDHDRRLAPSVISGYQLTALHERRNLFQGTRVTDPGTTEDGRFQNSPVAGAHSNLGGGYLHNGLSIRSGNLMTDYLNALSDRPFLVKRPEPEDPALNVIHRSEQHQVFYRTSEFDRNGARVHQELLAPPALCSIDCLDAEPRNGAMAASVPWALVRIGPVSPAPAQPVAERDPVVARLLEAAGRGDDAAVDRLVREWLDSERGKAWLETGQARLREAELAPSLLPTLAEEPRPLEWVR